MTGQYHSTLGALSLGVLTSGCLWGVSCAQAWHYFRQYPEDTLWVKLLVFGAWLFDTVEQILISYGLYYYSVINFSHPEALQFSTPVMAIQTVFQGLTAFLVQIFFAWRIWKMSQKNRPLTAVIVLLVFSQLGLVVANTVGNYHSGSFRELSEYNRITTSIGVGISVCADTLIAGALCIMLWHGRHANSSDIMVNQRTNNVIDKLMMFSISTGALTSICALAMLISLLLQPHAFVWMALFFVLGRLYMISLLVALNMRSTLRKRWTMPPQDRSFVVQLSAASNDFAIQSPTDLALKELQHASRPQSSISGVGSPV